MQIPEEDLKALCVAPVSVNKVTAECSWLTTGSEQAKADQYTLALFFRVGSYCSDMGQPLLRGVRAMQLLKAVGQQGREGRYGAGMGSPEVR